MKKLLILILMSNILAGCNRPYAKCIESHEQKYTDLDGLPRTREVCDVMSGEEFIMIDGVEYVLIEVF